MGALVGGDCQRAALFICKLRGGSQPILVEGTNGVLYVLKFSDNPQGPNVPFNEVAGAELFHACGLPVPGWDPLLLTDEFIDSNRDCWPVVEAEPRRPRAGLCFASRFLGSQNQQLIEILPGSAFNRIRNRAHFWLAWFIDICCEHIDNRQAIFLRDSEGWLHASFIDSGHLLSGARGDSKPNFWSPRYLDPRIYNGISSLDIAKYRRVLFTLNADAVFARILEMPQDWQLPSAVAALTRCLSRIANRQFANVIWEMLQKECTPGSETGRDGHQVEAGDEGRALLQLGIPARRREEPGHIFS